MTENEIQAFWAERKIGVAIDPSTRKTSLRVGREARPKFYHLVMFPYPSGNLHIGHWYAFAVNDTLARKKLMEGMNLLEPMGFDAFGLPAENAAIEHNIPPAEWTKQNVEKMTEQLKSMGAAYDWSRVVNTSDPDYYKWTQWLFLLMFKKGLAYRAKSPANWCPSCQTVLANEQVVAGRCERCETAVEIKDIDQWRLRITGYADRLLEDIAKLDWPEKTKIMQRNWIGRSEGRLIKFLIKGSNEILEVFTTRPDTIKGVTYMVVAPEHEVLVNDQLPIPKAQLVRDYIDRARHKTELERQKYDKSGVDTGLIAINPLTNEEVPIWVADYVLIGYGTGAIMAVPAHDERDRDFAEAHNLSVGSGELIDPPSDLGEPQVNYKLRDWIVSRQRYWGVPIPVIKCETCGYQPVPEEDLPVILPEIKEYLPKGKPPLATAAREWLEVDCPKCGGKAEREVETLDAFVDSSWYFLRYTDPANKKTFADRKLIDYWCPPDIYIGGAEHTVLHLLYSRFIAKVLFDEGLIGFDEPFPKLRHQGTILGPDRQKMSKSRGNVVDPDQLVADFGADAVRMYLGFMGPYDQGGPWNTDGFNGVVRFLKRIEKLRITNNKLHITNGRLDKLVKKVSEDTEQLKFNTAIAAMMSYLNEAEAHGIDSKDYQTFLKLLGPYAPHTAERLWQALKGKTQKSKIISIFEEKWPEYQAEKVKAQTVTIPVQINGKVRATVEIEADADEAAVKEKGLKAEPIASHLVGKTIKQVVYVPGRIVNFVVTS